MSKQDSWASKRNAGGAAPPPSAVDSLLSQAFRDSPNAMLLVGTDGTIRLANECACRLFGYRAKALRGMSVDALLPATKRDRHQRLRAEYLTRQHAQAMRATGNVNAQRQDGRVIEVDVYLTPLGSEAERMILATIMDASLRSGAFQRIESAADLDPLTGLPDRRLFRQRLSAACEALEDHNDQDLVLMLINIDGFRSVNDSLGHSAGDDLLALIAADLNALFDQHEQLARIAGDEFAVFFSTQDNVRLARLDSLISQINGIVAQPRTIFGHRIALTASVGVCQAGRDAPSAERMMRNADAALYRAKQSGKGRCCLYAPSDTERSYRHLQLDQGIRAALAGNAFQLAYQPQFDLADGALIGHEALLRWQHPLLGPISPAEFIPVAESSDLILTLGEWVIETVCRQAPRWLEHMPDEYRVAINVSAKQLAQDDFLDQLLDKLEHHRVTPERIEIEITESSLIHSETALRQLIAAKRHGIGVALDDFGTGYSSLAQLRDLPLTRLKIDKAFIARIAQHPVDQALLDGLALIGHRLGLSLMIEGVENQQQVDYLRTLLPVGVQGYFFGRPAELTDGWPTGIDMPSTSSAGI